MKNPFHLFRSKAPKNEPSPQPEPEETAAAEQTAEQTCDMQEQIAQLQQAAAGKGMVEEIGTGGVFLPDFQCGEPAHPMTPRKYSDSRITPRPAKATATKYFSFTLGIWNLDTKAMASTSSRPV